ncbi:YciI family protein [Spirosoma jeollabukense]
MIEFVLVFRRDYSTEAIQPTEKELLQHTKHWQDWFLSLAAQDKLARPIQRWDTQGFVIHPNKVVVKGPYLEGVSPMGGLIFIKAYDYREAKEIAQNAPILELGGTVEIRAIS